MSASYSACKESAEFILSKCKGTPEIGIILGTGLGEFSDLIEDAIEIRYSDIPNFLVSTAPNHAGKLIIGRLSGKMIVCMSGRFHYYEGYSFEQLAISIRVFTLLGVKKTILTNAAGAVNKGYRPGDVMIISDHINLMGVSPTRGRNEDAFGERFFDISDMYTLELRKIAKECAKHTTLRIHEGVYQFFCGPQFESPAEIRAARMLGADAVGMSTVPEALSAAHCGMPLLALALITNMAAGICEENLKNEDVTNTAKLVAEQFQKYVADIITRI